MNSKFRLHHGGKERGGRREGGRGRIEGRKRCWGEKKERREGEMEGKRGRKEGGRDGGSGWGGERKKGEKKR